MTDADSPRRSARDRAAKILAACYDGDRFGQGMLDELQSSDPLSTADAALAAELVHGVLHHRITAEHLASHYYRGRWAGLPLGVRVILAMAVYQLCWLDRIPDHAAVDQAVRQAKRYGRGTASTVNALLRKLTVVRGDVIDRSAESNPEPDPRCYLPIDATRGRPFKDAVFPDPSKRPLDHIIAVTSHPPWLVERWHRRFKPVLCREICDAGIRRPSLVLRPNTMRTTPEALAKHLESAGHACHHIENSNAIVLLETPPVETLEAFKQGMCQPQDSTAQVALTLSPPQPGEFVLDLCAGVGTKSTQAAEMMRNEGTVVAADTDGFKLERIPDTAKRLGIDIIQPTLIVDLPDKLKEIGRPPDLIVIDVPCSNTGVLARRPEARYRASQKTLSSLIEIQAELLQQAGDLAGPTTRMIYTTCSLEAEENEQQVEGFCRNHPTWRIEQQVFTTPNADRDGGFVAVLVQV